MIISYLVTPLYTVYVAYICTQDSHYLFVINEIHNLIFIFKGYLLIQTSVYAIFKLIIINDDNVIVW